MQLSGAKDIQMKKEMILSSDFFSRGYFDFMSVFECMSFYMCSYDHMPYGFSYY